MSTNTRLGRSVFHAWTRMLLLTLIVVTLSPVSIAKAAFIVSYTGTLTRAGADNAGLEGATFTLTAVFQSTPYVDNGLGSPSLPIDLSASSFVVSGAPLASSNGTYTFPFDLRMFPTLGGEFNVPPSNPTSFNHTSPDLRLIAFIEDFFGGSGSGAVIGQLPTLSDFPTSISATTVIALPANISYDILDASISAVETAAAVPEPSAIAMWLLILCPFALFPAKMQCGLSTT